MIGIYIIKCNVDNKVYIGQSINLKKRINEHKSLLKRNKHTNYHLQNSFNKYGEKNFIFDFLEILDEKDYTKERLDFLEIKYIEKFHSNKRYNGFNIENGGNSVGKLGEETRKKLSIALKGNKNNANAWTGKHHTTETKKLLSRKLKGKPSHWKGKKQSKEQIEKTVQRNLGRVWVSKDNESRFVTKEIAENLLKDGFVLGRPFQKRIKGKKYEYNGDFYTIPEISEMCGIDKTVLFSRIRNGWDIKKATETEKIEKTDKSGKHLYNGEYLNLTYISKLVNIPYETLRGRLRNGYSLEQAIKKGIKNG